MKNLKAVHHILISTVFLTACESQDDSKVTNKSKLVFDTRTTHQSRILLDKAVSSSGAESKQYSHTAFLSTGTAALYYDKIYNPDQNCDVALAPITGSSQLISPTRLVTAHHVIANHAGETIDVSFDSSDTTGSWIDDPDWSNTCAENPEFCEENPLLANRLWQLGLDYWAINYTVDPSGEKKPSFHKTGTRPALRKWLAVYDLEGTNPDGTSILNQPFISNPEKRRDIAFLRVVGLENKSFQIEESNTTGSGTFINSTTNRSGFVLSGSFQIKQPGVFFNQSQTSYFDKPVSNDPENTKIGTLVNDLEERTALQLLATPPWIDLVENAVNTQMPTASVDGLTDTPASDDANCANFQFCYGDPLAPTDSNYRRCLRTSLESVAGSSGGVMLMSPASYRGDEDVIIRSKNRRFSYGVVNGNKNQANDDVWAENQAVSSNNGFPTNDNYTSITLGSVDYERWGKRSSSFNDSQNLFVPTPSQPPSDGSPSCEQITDQDCSYSYVKSNGVWGPPEANAPILVHSDIPGDPDESGSAPPATDVPPSTRTQSVRIQCNYDKYFGDQFSKTSFRTGAGVAVGLIGTSNVPLLDEDSSVATMGIICAPWSTEPWIKNWNWVITRFRVKWFGEDVLENFTYQPLLRLVLPFMNEWRQERSNSDPYIRPVSMKTCPPNYYLKGVGVNYTDTELRGIVQLHCEDSSGDKLSTPLKPIEDSSTSFAWTYDVKGKKFSVEQRIGLPVSGMFGTKYTDLYCDESDEVVGGIQITKTSSEKIQEFWLECIAKPGTL